MLIHMYVCVCRRCIASSLMRLHQRIYPNSFNQSKFVNPLLLLIVLCLFIIIVVVIIFISSTSQVPVSCCVCLLCDTVLSIVAIDSRTCMCMHVCICMCMCMCMCMCVYCTQT